MVELLATSKMNYANTCLPGLLLPVPLSVWQATVNPRLQRRPSDICKQIWLNLQWGHCSFPLGPGVHGFGWPSKSLCFPQDCGSSVIKSHWPSKSDSLGILSPFPRSPGWEV